MTNLWVIGIGALIFILVAPAIANIASSVSASYSDPIMIPILFMIPFAIIILWVWGGLSG